jgi:hypothetical protein
MDIPVILIDASLRSVREIGSAVLDTFASAGKPQAITDTALSQVATRDKDLQRRRDYCKAVLDAVSTHAGMATVIILYSVWDDNFDVVNASG